MPIEAAKMRLVVANSHALVGGIQLGITVISMN